MLCELHFLYQKEKGRLEFVGGWIYCFPFLEKELYVKNLLSGYATSIFCVNFTITGVTTETYTMIPKPTM